MAGELAGVTPHENPAPDGFGDEEVVSGSSSRYGLGALSRPNSRLETPSDDPYYPGGRNDGGRVSDLRGMLTLEHLGQSIRPNVLRPGSVGQGEVKPAKQESPTRLPGNQPLRLPDVSEVFMVRPDKHGVLGALQPVSPLLQGSLDSQQLTVPHVIIPLHRGESPGQEGDWVDLLVLLHPLRQNGPDARVRSVDLDDELAIGVGEDEHRSRHEQSLEGSKGVLRLGSPDKPGGGGRKRGEGCSDPSEPPDESPIEVCESKKTSELGAIRGTRPLLHRPHLLGICPYTSLLQDVAEELYRGGGENTFLCLNKQPVLQQALEYLTNVAGVFRRGLGKH